MTAGTCNPCSLLYFCTVRRSSVFTACSNSWSFPIFRCEPLYSRSILQHSGASAQPQQAEGACSAATDSLPPPLTGKMRPPYRSLAYNGAKRVRKREGAIASAGWRDALGFPPTATPPPPLGAALLDGGRT
ncbi:hypothetical protein GOODEAATRI_005545 [Goodea atripinnis]|uniref:Uncharacterized protein n=1 Tax=Goodea atripinnis TaxID=208336 RepID=A0ABV0MGD9_9TELE